jgi:hypothetical protein
MKTLMKSILTAAVLSVSMEPGLFIRAHTLFFWQPEVALRKDGRVRSPSGPLTLVASNSQPHRKTGRLGDAALYQAEVWKWSSNSGLLCRKRWPSFPQLLWIG